MSGESGHVNRNSRRRRVRQSRAQNNMAKYASYLGTTEKAATVRMAMDSAGGGVLRQAIERKRAEVVEQTIDHSADTPERGLRTQLGFAAGLKWVLGLINAAETAVDGQE